MIMQKSCFTRHGFHCLSNHGGMEIQLSTCGESARLKYYGKKSRWQQIKFSRSGIPFVTYYNRRFLISAFIKS